MVKGKLERLLDPTQKIFEGDVKVEFFGDRMICKGYCWHCKSRTEMVTMLDEGEAKQLLCDPQFQRNLVELAKEDLQNDHQCGLLYEGRDVIEDVFKHVGRQ